VPRLHGAISRTHAAVGRQMSYGRGSAVFLIACARPR
jgi:hypothetical protein